MAEPDAHTLGRWIADRAALHPQRTAIEADGRAVAYAELHSRTERLAAQLAEAGYRRGDRLATLSGNSAEQVLLCFACAKLGLILAPLSWRLSSRELAFQLDDAEPALLAVEGSCRELARAALDAAAVRPAVGQLAPNSVEIPPRAEVAAPIDERVCDDDPLLLLYTSGTTGRPKGALLTQANCFWTNLSLSRTAELSSADVVLQVLPQFHVGGWNVQPLLALWCGATVVIERAFEAGRVLDVLARRGVTTMMGVPANYQFLAEHPDFAAADLSALRYALVGGAPMPEPLLRRWQERGIALVQGYGLTEAAPNVLCLPAGDATRKLGYAGKAYPHVDVALADPDTGEPLTGPARGELLVRGPNVFAGYWRNEDASRQAFRDGWLRTGDVACRDAEGFYRIHDRCKDMFVSGGENVYPAEVEARLYEHPGVREAAVIEIPDPRWGEVGLAVVARAAGDGADEAALLDHCRAGLARYKTPKAVQFVAALPRTATGKIDKPGLREGFGRQVRT
jgi:fatty-acyl-CoA synthase